VREGVAAFTQPYQREWRGEIDGVRNEGARTQGPPASISALAGIAYMSQTVGASPSV
jgi:hypothetical protein